MTSLLTSSRQVSSDSGYYIPVGNCANKIFQFNNVTGQVSSGVAPWAASGNTAGLISTAGAGILRDMGKTVVSSGRTFRKVQLLVSTGVINDGVGGEPVSGGDYLTGYIELGFGSAPGSVAPVAAYGR